MCIISHTVFFFFFNCTGLPVSNCKDLSGPDSTVPIVTDSCGLYGTFYMDLMGSGLKTFNSPGRCPKMPHRLPKQQGTETIQIFNKPAAKSLGSQEALPWKQAIRPQPRMGVKGESWEKSHSKLGECCVYCHEWEFALVLKYFKDHLDITICIHF